VYVVKRCDSHCPVQVLIGSHDSRIHCGAHGRALVAFFMEMVGVMDGNMEMLTGARSGTWQPWHLFLLVPPRRCSARLVIRQNQKKDGFLAAS
jgi:hypothetical protein